MRILITTSPGIGHFFPLITTAWALRSAGHDVIMATPMNAGLVAKAGLPAVDPAPGFDFPTLFRNFVAANPRTLQPGAETQGGDMEAGLRIAAALFSEVSEPSVDRVVELARDWAPELIVHGPVDGAGPIAASVIGVPAVMHGISMGQMLELNEGVGKALAASYARYGASQEPAAAFLDVSPSSLRPSGSPGRPMRYVPYNGGGVLESWLTTPRERPRITVTLGSVVPMMAGVGALGQLASAAGDVAAEFVFALGGGDLSALGTLPSNVRVVGWTPLNALLRVSDAAVHHGGAGTTMTALAAGTPQLVLPQGADQFLNAAAVTKAGAGATVRADDLDAQRLSELLTDTAMGSAADAIAADMAAQPSPADLVDDLIALAR